MRPWEKKNLLWWIHSFLRLQRAPPALALAPSKIGDLASTLIRTMLLCSQASAHMGSAVSTLSTGSTHNFSKPVH